MASGKATLEEFISNVRTKGLLTATHYYVRFGNSGDKDITMMCDSVNLPGLTIGTTDVRVFGENREIPYMPIYPSLELQFIVDRDMKVRKFFEEWSNKVINRETRNVGYYNDYAGSDIEIIVTDKKGDAVYCAKVVGAYPKQIQDIRLAYDAEEVIRLNVTMSFKYWVQVPVSASGEAQSTKEIGETNGERSGSDTEAPSAGANVKQDSGNFAADSKKVGDQLGSDAGKASSASAALIKASPNGNSTTSSFANGLLEIGKKANDIGASIGQLGQGISDFVAPIQNLSNSITAISSTFGVLNGLASTLGLGTPFANIQNRLNNNAAKLGAVAQIGGIPGQLASLGGTFSAINTAFGGLGESIGQKNWGTEKIKNSVKSLGASFGNGGTGVSNLAGNLQNDISTGKIDGGG